LSARAAATHDRGLVVQQWFKPVLHDNGSVLKNPSSDGFLFCLSQLRIPDLPPARLDET
jgi:hypothetical protein